MTAPSPETLATRSLDLLRPADAAELQRLAADPEVARLARLPHPYPEGAAAEFLAWAAAERAAGRAYHFAIRERGQPVGVCGLNGADLAQGPELGYWVGRTYWGRGYATFAAGLTLEFAFRNLRVEVVHAVTHETNAASARVLEKQGFLPSAAGIPPHLRGNRPLEQRRAWQLTRAQYRAFRDGPVLAALHPALRPILAAELAAGNEVAETGGGWPDPDSLFVRLARPFFTRPDPLPEEIVYSEPNDPHWWMADYSTRAPRHILACPLP